MTTLANTIRKDRRLNGTARGLAAEAEFVEMQLLRSARARAPLRLVNERLARKDEDGSYHGREEAGAGEGST